MRQIISETTGPVFLGFVELRKGLRILNPFCDRSKDVAITTNFIGEIGVFWIAISQIRFQQINRQ